MAQGFDYCGAGQGSYCPGTATLYPGSLCSSVGKRAEAEDSSGGRLGAWGDDKYSRK